MVNSHSVTCNRQSLTKDAFKVGSNITYAFSVAYAYELTEGVLKDSHGIHHFFNSCMASEFVEVHGDS